MKKSLIILLLGVVVGVVSCSFTSRKQNDTEKDKLLIDLITFVLEKVHYDAREINDDFSEEVYHKYLKALDPQKRYFYADDIDNFEKYKLEIDNQINAKDLSFFKLTYNTLQKRMKNAAEKYESYLEKPFDFSKTDSISLDFEALNFVSNKKEMKDRWKSRLKFSTLSTFYEKKAEEIALKEKDSTYIIKSDKVLEEKAREVTKSSIKEYFDFTDDLRRKDWFAVYINAIIENFDPHTYYFAPQDKDRFDISMSGKLEGIGARLQKKDDYIKIVELISGGPAWRGEVIEVGDIILKVKQEDEKDPISIVGMRLDDAVKLIKGPKGTKVTLTLKRVDGSIENIDIIRDIVELEETYAKSSLIKNQDKTYGIINLPKFYFNMEDYKERNAAIDIKKEIKRLKEKNIEGLILDLRNNGGGSLKAVVDIAGLFIEKGPIVQVKTKESDAQILADTDKSIEWNGPLVIMVNELSASASEILAAAMQDYERGIIIGSPQTYGKGTVQNLMDLNRWLRNSDIGDLGAIKVTTQKFYRVNGGSTQLEGVKSDIIVPDRYTYIDIGEKDLDNPLVWDKIPAASYEKWSQLKHIDSIINRSKARMKDNAFLQIIEDDAKWIAKQKEINEFSMNYKDYKEKINTAEKKIEYLEKVEEFNSVLTFESLPYEIELITKDSILGEKRRRWHKNLKQDIYVDEAVNVLSDISSLNAE